MGIMVLLAASCQLLLALGFRMCVLVDVPSRLYRSPGHVLRNKSNKTCAWPQKDTKRAGRS